MFEDGHLETEQIQTMLKHSGNTTFMETFVDNDMKSLFNDIYNT